ncbi:hypothetical protein MATL_G00152850 [Megalops atlanticus]|uniref:Trafficking protein, kinesin binding 2 n=1 Tax=Megalops atlanticus TaxID=7932 RepID=A0A9D3T5C7_MEGAT|nr:hypothetical protein MATL_G00152850 [Megalops atlanticus]
MSVEQKDSSSGPDEGSKEGVAGLAWLEPPKTGCESLYLYDSQDWVVSPRCSPEETSAISPMLAEETFRYMTFLALEPSSLSHPGSHSLSQVLSADRVEQMTKTYNDIDVVTHLLAERDRDLELAARIGQSLLQRNHVLQERNEAIEEQLTQALDQVRQLQHDLGKKEELLRMVASASEESETDSSCSTPLHLSQPLGAALPLSQLEALQSKLQELEEENLALRSEACHLKSETISYEEKEQQLVNDCVKELRESNSQMAALTDELSKKNEDLLWHQEEMAQLLTQMVELQHRVKQLALEKEELRIHLQASKDAQRQLTAELNELWDRNAECVGMLQESQEEVRELRSKSTPCAGMRRHMSYGLFPMDSLAAEIEGTMRRELSLEEEQDQKNSQKRVFQTVRSVNDLVRAHATPHPIPGSAHSSVVMTAQPFRSCLPPAQTHSGEEPTPNNSSKEGTRLGQPGSPGGSDLVSALRRLTLRRQNFLCERQFFQAERDRKLQALGKAGQGDGPEGGEGSGRASPDGSVLSGITNVSDLSAASSFKSFLPEKLQIVKPMEGSLTLHHWQQLAQPHLATILDPHPGVVTKGFRPLPQDAVYSLADPEEDEDEEQRRGPGACQKRREEKEEEEEEEEGGITFQVRCASTPEDKKERRSERASVCSLANVPPQSPPPRASPTPPSGSAAPCIPSAPQRTKSHILSTTAPSPAHNPGKCLSSTFSTYTFTTCRILHPCDVTQVTPSSLSSVSENTPSSLRTGPSTPVTPCRLSLGDSFPPRRVAAPRGLAQLLLEKGISAQVSAEGDPPTRAPSQLPSTPPNSPSHSPSPSPVPFETRPPSSDNFLASRPAELFLQDVYGLKLSRPRPELPSPAPPPSLALAPDRGTVGLAEQLRRLGFAGVPRGAEAGGARRLDSATLLPTGGASLLDGLRRNQSLPAMAAGRGQAVSSPSRPALPPHPSSLAIPTPPWGSLKRPVVSSSSSSSSSSQVPPPHKA